MSDQTPASAPPAPPAPPAELVRSPLSDGEWHRMHPLSPLLRGGLALIVVVGIVIANLRDRLIGFFLPGLTGGAVDAEDWESAGDPIDWVLANNLVLLALLVVLAGILLLVGAFWLAWRFHTFRITQDRVEVRSGILFRTQRRAPLDRVQGVNLTRPMIARLLGMAKLEIIGAGTDGNVKLDYLSTTNAEAVRADILRLASGRRLGEGAVRGADAGPRGAALAATVGRGLNGLIEGDDQEAATPDSVVHIPTGRLVASQIVSPSTVWLLATVVAIVVGAIVGVPWLLFAFIPGVIGFGAYWVRQIVRSLRYSIAPTPDGVRITFGLLTTITEIVPPGRIHAIEVTQSILWRGFGWWSIRINRLSGRSMTDTTTDQFTTVLPVGTLADVERVLGLLLPDVEAARWHAILHQGVTGPHEGDPFTTTPGRARIIRLLSWRRNGFLLGGDLLLLRRGLIWRKLALLPLARLQSIGIHQGPLDRLLRVAAVRGHLITGPVYANVSAIDRDDALALFAATARSAVAAAGTDRSHRWAGDAPDLSPAPVDTGIPSRDKEMGRNEGVPGGFGPDSVTSPYLASPEPRREGDT